MRARLALLIALSLAGRPAAGQGRPDPLPSWNDGPSKRAILEFVAKVTTEGSPDFVPAAARVATFDNDGTLWPEQPVYTQVVFAVDRIKALAPSHPDWREKPPFKAALEGDLKALFSGTARDRIELLAASHAGMTTDEFERIVLDWMATARHPRFKRPYTELAYLPMLELLAHLRASGFTTYIVSGGGVEFMRPWTGKVYGVPPERVVGSAIKLKYEDREGGPALVRLPEIDFVDDGDGKPVGIQKAIGRRPVLAFGNSDGDHAMLRWATSGPGPRLGLILRHTDAAREYLYDREAHVGQLARALDDAPRFGWVVVDMAAEWKAVFAPENSPPEKTR